VGSVRGVGGGSGWGEAQDLREEVSERELDRGYMGPDRGLIRS